MAASASEACPVVLVSGFLGPNNEAWCERYWGEAAALSTQKSPVLVVPVSCVGSALDRACEMFARILGTRVDYGEAHAAEAGHARFGKDYTGSAAYAAWSAEHPIHVVGHSFGGNTVRVFKYLVATDYFGVGTSAAWVRSTTTLSSPLKGSLLTYKLGASEDHNESKPVHRFSPGYMLGLSVHFYELFCHKTGLDAFFDFGMSQWNVEEKGLKFFLYSLLGGSNGGGTPAVCARDNAAHDMTIQAAFEWNERIAQAVAKDPHHTEFNFVANKKNLLNYSLVGNTRELFRPRSVTSLSSGSSTTASHSGSEIDSDSDDDDYSIAAAANTDIPRQVGEPVARLSEAKEAALLLASDDVAPIEGAAAAAATTAAAPATEESSFLWRGTLFLRDFWVYHLAKRVFASKYAIEFAEKHHEDAFSVKEYIESGGDGLCNAFAQFESNSTLREEDLDAAHRKLGFAPGQYTVLMNERHDHFSVVPFPDSTTDQREFFQRLFRTLRNVQCPPLI
ncbi:Hypothetical Protein FCC1311_095661 [Hondaea fermentalgiana]|uniref:Lipase-like C-terminal domain-containing protein n=1 Tax=Hondaea fermentalgiana TaxID=2315210 RepID=A0A2R5GA17_9STRA|nr:Hypothetical Protein FCC1311_095661 [Hondaea fermentalgiana]|eukprot:GBG27867.1 Hypothetical Protein FCC1311_095661 [Hondaea fermentalgiana]